MRVTVALIAILATGCSPLLRRSASPPCTDSPPSDARPATADRIGQLAGRFRLTEITTSFAIQPSVTELVLHAPDSAARANAVRRFIGHVPRRNLRLVGSWHWSSRYPAVNAEWDAGILYLGCRDCLDGSPEHLRIEAISDHGFWGRWADYQTGIGHIVDKSGKPLPDPAGYFCAEWLGKAP